MTDFSSHWVDVQAKLGGVWTSLSLDPVYTDEEGRIRGKGVTITRGKNVDEQRTNPGECSFTLNNRDGKYTKDNPRSPLWKQLGINTECRVVALPYESHIYLPARPIAGDKLVWADDSATLDITGDFELRVDIHAERYGQRQMPVITKYVTGGDQRSWFLSLDNTGILQFYWSSAGTLATRRVIESSAAIPAGRTSIRLQFDVNNGSGGVTATWWTGPSLDGPWTALGTPATQATTTSIFSSTAAVEIGSANDGDIGISGDYGDLFVGKFYGARLYNGLTGTLAAEADFTQLGLDDLSVSDGTTTWEWSSPVITSSDKVRGSFQIPAWPIKWNSNAVDVTSDMKALGLFKYLADGATVLDSPMKAFYSSVPNRGYWPGEDLSEATYVSSAVAGVRSGRAIGISFAGAGDLPGSLSVMKIEEGSSAGGSFPAYANTGEYAFTFAMYIDQTPAVDTTVMALNTSTYQVTFTVGAAGTFEFDINEFDGTSLDSSGTAYGDGAEPGNWVVMVLEAAQNGGNVDWVFNWRTLDSDVGYFQSGSFAGSVGILRSWQIPGLPSGSSVNTLGVGHIAGVDNVDYYLESEHLKSFRGYRGETDIERLARIHAQEGIHFRVKGEVSPGVTLGPQPITTFLGICDDTVKVGRGIFTEQRDRLGTLYITRPELENQIPYSIDYTDSILSGSPEIDDNPLIVNDAIVRRTNGGFSRSTDDDGLRGVNAIGRYTLDDTYNVFTDEDTANLAGLIRHIGSWPDLYFSNVPFNLARNAIQDSYYDLESLIGLDLGRWIELTDLPDFLPTRPALLLLERYVEYLTRFEWTIDMSTSAARPYKTAQMFNYPVVRVGSNSSTLNTGIDDNDTTLSVAVSSQYGHWAFSSSFEIEVDDREFMTVTNITGSSTPYTFTVTRGSPSFSHDAGVPVRLKNRTFIKY